MNYRDKTKDEIIKELSKLQQEYDSLIISYEKDITERKKAEEELQRSEMQYRSLAENSPDLIARFDWQYRHLYVNQVAAKAGRYSPCEYLGKTIAEVGIRTVFETGQVVDVEDTFGTSDGLRYFNTRFVPEFDPDGSVQSVQSIARDITERKRVEEMLQKSELKYRNLIEQAPDIIFIVDAEGNLLYVNQTGQKMLGYSEDELCKMKTVDTYPTDEMTVGRRRLKEFRTMRAGEAMHFERLMRRKDGSSFPVEINVGALEDGTTHAIIRDITERKLAEEALLLEKENFRHSLDDSPLGVRITTIEGNTIYANKTLLDFYGYDSLEELQKTPLKDRYTPESYALAQERKLQRERGDFSATDYEISIVRKDGEIRHLQVFCKEVFWDGVRQFQVICNDITERRQAEKAQRENEELFRIVVSNTPISIFATDDKGIFILHEGKALEKVGMKPGENVGVSAYDLFSDLKVVEYNGNVISGKSVLNRVLNGKNLSGFTELNEVHFDNQFVPILDINNHVKGLIGVATDVTISQKMEETLRESEARFRSLFENSLIGISTASHDGKLLQANPVCARMYGYENPEMMLAEVTNVGKLYANTADRKEVLRILERKGFMEAKEYEVIRRDGSRFFVLVSACEIRDAEGKLLYNQATHIDLTERRKAVEEIRKSKKLLEDLHKHLNEILENDRALISREIHDQIGQSLTALKLDLNWMRKYINTNKVAVTKLEGMIELVSTVIKDVQRISSDLRPGILDDLGLVAALEWYLSEFEERTGIRCNLKFDDSTFGDSQRNLVFFRVLQEALTNVIRHANASSVTVRLHQSKKGTTLTIQDNGIGMQPGKAESAKSLGLIGMHERVKQFDGKVDISSKKGKGTKLTIFIPEKKKTIS